MPENKLPTVSIHPLHNTIFTPQYTKLLISDQVEHEGFLAPPGVTLQVGSRKQGLIVAEDKEQGRLRLLKSTLLQAARSI
jgi:hypothetical protein